MNRNLAFGFSFACLPVLLASCSDIGSDQVAEETATQVSGVLPRMSLVSGVKTNGLVRSVLINGRTLYVGGSFTKAWSNSQKKFVTRNGFVAYNIPTSGSADITDLVLNVDAGKTVRAMVTDGSTLFLGGSFSSITTAKKTYTRSKLAAVTLATKDVNSLSLSIDDSVLALALGANDVDSSATSALFFGGKFTHVNAQGRGHVASVNVATAQLNPFNPGANDVVSAVVANPLSPSAVFIGGKFTSICGDGALQYLVEARNSDSGCLQMNNPLTDEVLGLDASSFVLAVAVGGAANRVVSYDTIYLWPWWATDKGPATQGDAQAVALSNDYAYWGFHDGLDLSPDEHKLARLDVNTGDLDRSWPMPNFGKPTQQQPGFMGVYAVDADINSALLAAGGDFRQVGTDTNHQFLAVFRNYQ